MKKLLKITGVIFATIILLSALIVVSVFTMVNPNRFKPFITAKIKESTGLQLVIDGDLSWASLPYIGIKAKHLTVDPVGLKQKTFIELTDVTFKVKLVSLLHYNKNPLLFATEFDFVTHHPILSGHAILMGDMNFNTSHINVNGKITPFQLEKSANQKQRISLSGNGNFEFTYASNGQGHYHITMDHGVLHGIDIAYLINSARAIAKLSHANPVNTYATPFNHLTATGVIDHGVISNDDLSLQTAMTHSSGKGTINITNQQIDYELLTTINKEKQKNDIANLYGIALPIDIVGTLDHPKMTVNTNAILSVITTLQVKHLQAKLEDQIKNNSHGKHKHHHNHTLALLKRLLEHP